MRIALRVVPLCILIVGGIVVTKRYSFDAIRKQRGALLAEARSEGLLPASRPAGREPWFETSPPLAALLPPEGARALWPLGGLVHYIETLDAEALMPYPEAFLRRLDERDWARPRSAGTSRLAYLAPFASTFQTGRPATVLIAEVERLAGESGQGSTVARRLEQLFGLHACFDESLERPFLLIQGIEWRALEALEPILASPSADLTALYARLDPWLEYLGSSERFTEALMGEFMREYGPQFELLDRNGSRQADWSRALVRLECYLEAVRGLHAVGAAPDMPGRDTRGRLFPPMNESGPTHELIDMEFAAQRHRRSIALARVALAVGAYRARAGAFPVGLSELSAELEAASIVDPATGFPFLYTTTPTEAVVGCDTVSGGHFEPAVAQYVIAAPR